MHPTLSVVPHTGWLPLAGARPPWVAGSAAHVCSCRCGILASAAAAAGATLAPVLQCTMHLDHREGRALRVCCRFLACLASTGQAHFAANNIVPLPSASASSTSEECVRLYVVREPFMTGMCTTCRPYRPAP